MGEGGTGAGALHKKLKKPGRLMLVPFASVSEQPVRKAPRTRIRVINWVVFMTKG